LCPKAFKNIRFGKKPQICGFSGKTPIVCCPADQQIQQQAPNAKTINQERISVQSNFHSNSILIFILIPIFILKECNEYKNLAKGKVTILTLGAEPGGTDFYYDKCEKQIDLIVGGKIFEINFCD
jgi:hypothetical protein